MDTHEPDECLVTWPITQPEDLANLDAALIPTYATLQHHCKLLANHIHRVWDPHTLDTEGQPAPTVIPHQCHCGAWMPVRDVEAH